MWLLGVKFLVKTVKRVKQTGWGLRNEKLKVPRSFELVCLRNILVNKAWDLLKGATTIYIAKEIQPKLYTITQHDQLLELAVLKRVE